MRFGLDRMRRMMTVLGSPERRFDAIHVLGTNGKSSTTRMTAAILERHGLRTGAYLSPHLVSYRERVLIDGRELDADAFAAAIARASWAAERVNRTLAEDDHVTQFELLTAAALWEMARAGGGGGGRGGRARRPLRRDQRDRRAGHRRSRTSGSSTPAGSGRPSRTSPRRSSRSCGRAAALVLGSDLAAPALAVAERVARERGARIVRPRAAPAATELLRARGAFQRRNFALARAAAEAYLQAAGIPLREQAVAQAAAATEVPGRLQLVDEDPPTVLDGAHNPDAVAALVAVAPGRARPRCRSRSCSACSRTRTPPACSRRCCPLCERAWFTAPPSSRALSPAALQSLARQLGFDASACEPQPVAGARAGAALGAERAGAVLATGSVYLVGDLLGRLGPLRCPAGATAQRSPGARPR